MAANSFVATTHASGDAEVERNQSNLVAHFRPLGASIKRANFSKLLAAFGQARRIFAG